METDDRQPPPWRENLHRLGERRLDRRQFVVDGNTQRLKGARGRMNTPAPPPPPHGALDDRCQFLCRVKWPGGQDRFNDPPRLLLLAVAVQERRQFLWAEAVHQVGGGRAATCGIEAHVQRPVRRERQPAAGIGQLQRGKPQVEQDAINGHELLGACDLCQVNERTMLDHHPPEVRGQTGAGHVHRRRISIQAQETPVGRRGRQYTGRVPSTPYRRIYVPAARPDLQAVEHRLKKNRDVSNQLRCLEPPIPRR